MRLKFLLGSWNIDDGFWQRYLNRACSKGKKKNTATSLATKVMLVPFVLSNIYQLVTNVKF